MTEPKTSEEMLARGAERAAAEAIHTRGQCQRIGEAVYSHVFAELWLRGTKGVGRNKEGMRSSALQAANAAVGGDFMKREAEKDDQANRSGS